MTNRSSETATNVPETLNAIRRWTAKAAVGALFMAAVLFGSAGTFRWTGAWWYLALIVGTQLLTGMLLYARQPELLAERSAVQQGSKTWDAPLATLMAIIGPVAMAVIAGLDVRYEWIGYVSRELALRALLVAAAGSLLGVWAMVTNAFFSSVIRIQEDRGHHVVSSGPYRLVRHPGYLGAILTTVATPYVLGSRWAVFAAWVTVAVILLRTWLEDRTLGAELPGYREYARRTRYRLFPWIW